MAVSISGDGAVTGIDSDASSDLATQFAAKLDTPGAWTSYTPTLYNMTIGNGTVDAAYCQIGKLVHVRIHIVFGSTTSVSSAAIRFSAPVSIADAGVLARLAIGTARLRDEGTADYLGVINGDASGTSLEFLTMITTGTYTQLTGVGPTIPHTWAANDDIWGTCTYEAA